MIITTSPTTTRSSTLPQAALDSLSPDNRITISRLINHEPEYSDLSIFPRSRLAAVLIVLFEKEGQLRVLLTTRSKDLRSHPGQTALPGGRFDEVDKDFVDTAFREAAEEVSFPRNSPHIHILCKLRPFISLYKLVVTPIVVFLTDLSVLDTLVPSADEVDRIFDHPLEALLDPSLVVSLGLKLALRGPKGSDWQYPEEIHNWSDHPWLGYVPYRMNRFRSTASPVKGLTADILTMLAEVAYDRLPVYDRWATGQPRTWQETEVIVKKHDEEEKTKAEAEAMAASRAMIVAMDG